MVRVAPFFGSRLHDVCQLWSDILVLVILFENWSPIFTSPPVYMTSYFALLLLMNATVVCGIRHAS